MKEEGGDIKKSEIRNNVHELLVLLLSVEVLLG